MACCSGLQPQRWLPRHILRFFCDNDLLTVSVLSPPSAAAAEECLGAVFEALRLRADTPCAPNQVMSNPRGAR